MSKIRPIAFAVLAALGLSGCLVPDNYEYTLEIWPDGKYRSVYSGDMTSALHLADIRSGKVSEGDKAFADFEASLDKTDGVEASYLSDARYAVKIDREGRVGRLERLPLGDAAPLITITKNPSGRLEISGVKLGKADKEQLESLGVSSSGTVCVKLHDEGNVIDHNADSTPSLISGCYKWKMENWVSNPKEIRMVIGQKS